MNEQGQKIKGKKLKETVRKAAALILSDRFRTRGAPQSRIEKIFRKEAIPLQLGLRETGKELEDVGVKLKEIQEKWHGQKVTRYLGIINPNINLEDIRPYNRRTTAILALIASKGQRNPFSEIRKEIEKIVEDKEEASDLLDSAISTLEEDGVVRFDKETGVIQLTDYGTALLPSKDQINSVIIDTLVSARTTRENHENKNDP